MAAFFANLGIAIAKFAAFAITGAAALLAEAVHSCADTGNQGLLFLGGHKAKKNPSKEHPFGYGRERFFWSFVVALVLFSLGSLFAIYEGITKLSDPHPIEDPTVAFVVLGLAIVLEGLSLRTARREANAERGGRSWWRFIESAKSPELPVVLLEDFGAIVGLLIALAGVGLSAMTGNSLYDALGSIGIGLLLGVIAIVLATEMKSLLIGESATEQEVAAIDLVITQDLAVRKLIFLRTQHLGPEELLVAAKVEFNSESVGQLIGAINTLEASIRKAVNSTCVIFIEPDVYRPELD